MDNTPSHSDDFEKVFIANLKKAGITIIVFLVIVLLLGWLYEEELLGFTGWVADSFGLLGLCFTAFFMDFILTPIPPDLLILIISKSHFSENWFPIITLLGLISTLAGISGWTCARLISRLPRVSAFVEPFLESHKVMVKKYGFRAIVIGALTPIPFSLICWSTGFLRVPFKDILIGSLCRLPRYWVYYIIIDSSIQLTQFF